MRIILATHADDAELQDEGLKGPAYEIACALAGEVGRQVVSRSRVAAVYTAPQPSAVATAGHLAQELSLPQPSALPALGEGIEGETLAALRRVQSSAWTAIERLKEDHGADDQLLLVTPPLTVQAVVCRALTMPVEDFQRFRIDHGSLTIIEFRAQQNRTILVSLNETCHLAGLEAP